MRIFLVHSHLNPGGVTRIIQSTLQAFQKFNVELDIHLVVGDCIEFSYYKEFDVTIHIVPEINYLPFNFDDTQQFNELYKKIHHAFHTLIKREDIIHVHNLNLGKNPVLIKVLYDFVNEGFKLINHSHDFAEDRPLNLKFIKHVIEDHFYLKMNEVLYPKNDNYTYIVLNTFDKRRLLSYGIPEHRIQRILNPVSFNFQASLTKPEARKKLDRLLNLQADKLLFTYPVRVIRRKNIGEYILLAWLFKEKANWLVTLPPKNPIEIKIYSSWRKFCHYNKIPIEFEVGQLLQFEDIISASDACITTSKQEGFGMAFLEPWIMDTPVSGRDIQMVTEDIKQSGIQFPLLYKELKIEFKNFSGDFKDLNEDLQRDSIKEMIVNKAFREKFLLENDFLQQLFEPVPVEIIEHNKAIVKENYSLQQFAKQIYAAYTNIS